MKAFQIVPVLLLVCATSVQAQTPQVRAQTLAGEFTKFKHHTKVKHGVSHEKYKDVVSEAWISSRMTDYAGTYRADDRIRIEISIDNTGRVAGSGRDEQRFVLRDVKIAGALLTGSKVYDSGATEAFEAVLLKRSDRGSPDARYTITYGIGWLVDSRDNGVGTPLRVFAARQ